MPRFTPLAPLLGVLVILAGFSLRAAAPHADYAAKLSAAQSLAAESSQARALIAYREALSLAPDDEQRRWCELGILEAEYAMPTAPGDRELVATAARALLAAHEKASPIPDPFWLSARNFNARLETSANQLAYRLETANRCAQQPPSPAAFAALARSAEELAGAIPQAWASSRTQDRALRDALFFLQQSAVALPAGDLRARVALLRARALERQRGATETERTEIAQAFDAAVAAAARGTLIRAETLVRRADWLMRFGPLSGPARQTAASREVFAAMLTKLDEATAVAAEIPTHSDLYYTAANLSRSREALVKPALNLLIDGAFLPDSRIPIGVWAQHVGQVQFAIHRLSLDEFAAFASAGWNNKPKAPTARPLHRWTVETGIVENLGRAFLRQSPAEKLEPGAYAVVASDPRQQAEPAMRWFLVSDAQAIVDTTPDGFLEVTLFHQETGAQITDARLRLHREAQILAVPPTGAGMFRVNIADWGRAGHPVTLVGETAGHPFFISNLHPQSPRGPEWQFHLNTDRQLYRPGETAQWKITARALKGGELLVPAGGQLRVEAKLNRDTVVGTWTGALSRFGTASGKFELPATLASGQVTFKVESEWAPTGDGSSQVEAFFVDRFRPPEIELKLAAADAQQIRRARPGGEVELTLSARYFSGEPVAGATIALTTSFTKKYHYTDYREDGSFTMSGADNPSPVSLNFVTDERGQATARVTIPPNVAPRSSITTTARLTGQGTGSTQKFEFAISPEGYTAAISAAGKTKRAEADEPSFFPQKSRLYGKPGESLRLTVATRDGRNEPVSAQGDIALHRLTWEEIWRAPTGDLFTGAALAARKKSSPHWPPRDELGWEKIRADYRTESVLSLTTTTNAEGHAEFATRTLSAGFYRMTYHDAAARAAEPAAQLEIYVADETTASLPVNLRSPLVLPCDPEPTPGQPLRALVVLPTTGRPALVSLAGLATAVTRVEAFPGNTRLVEFPWQPGYWAVARIDVAAFDSSTQPAHGGIFPSRAAHAVGVTLEPAAPTTQPGAKTRVLVRTTDTAGRPLASQLALAAVDEAVAALSVLKCKPATETFLARRALEWRSVQFTAPARFYAPNQKAPLEKEAITMREEAAVQLDMFSVSGMSTSYGAMAMLASDAPMAKAPPPGGGSNSPRTRSNFSYTATWQPEIATDDRGEATVEFTYPDTLTAWKISAEAVADGNRFGHAQTTVRSTLPLQARLRAPRVLVAGDSVSLLGALVNGTDRPLSVRGELTSGATGVIGVRSAARQTSEVPANSERALLWKAHALTAGEATLRLTTTSPRLSDAMELRLPVLEDGFEQKVAAAGRATDRTLDLTLALPEPLDRPRTLVEVQVSPGVVPALVEALPYLIDYPYGCIEQTMSRFIPAALVARLLRDLGFSAAEIDQRIAGARAKNPPGRAAAAGLDRLDDVIAQSLQRLVEAQLPGGGFGWFPRGSPDSYMTAYVLRGLNYATGAGLAIPSQLRDQTRQAVFQGLRNNPDLAPSPTRLAWTLAAVAECPEQPSAEESAVLKRTFEHVYAQRDKLSASGLALLARTAHAFGHSAEVAVLRRNLDNAVIRSRAAETGPVAHWGQTSRYFDGMNGAVESTALALHALLAIDPAHELVDAAAAWLLLNRESNRWSNTRDSALALLALHDYAKARGDTAAEGGFRLMVNGRTVAERRLDRASLLAPASFAIDPVLLMPGENRITLEPQRGRTPLFVLATSRAWAQAGRAVPAGEFLTVKREFVRVADTPTVLGTTVAQPMALPANAASLPRNERLESRLVLEVKHPLDYVAIESPKPAGCEPLNPLSGRDATLAPADGIGNGPRRSLYREEHDDRSVFFLEHLPAGRWEIRYQMRATFAGDFRALPVTTGAMYAPAISANTDARRVAITEQRE